MTSDETHQIFLKSLDASQRAVRLIATWLQERGHTVAVNPVRRAPTHGDWKEFSDSGDLILLQRAEVKQLGRDFTGRHDWPFGDKFIVCSKHSYDRAPQKPYVFIYVNPAETHIATVMGETAKFWTVDTRTDSRVQRSQQFYFAPMQYVKFARIEWPHLASA